MTKDNILKVSLSLAKLKSWDALRLQDVAAELDITLAELQYFVREKDEIAELLFDRADRMMLEGEVDTTNSVCQKLAAVICLWLSALESNKTTVCSMLMYKLEPGHFHFQARAITRISRTVQWFMEAAGVTTTGIRRSAEEVILTTIFLKTFFDWMKEKTNDKDKTKKRLLSMLTAAEQAAKKIDSFYF